MLTSLHDLWHPAPTSISGLFAHLVTGGDTTSVTDFLRGSMAKSVRAWALELDYPWLPVTSSVTLGKLLTSLCASFPVYKKLSSNHPKT